MKRFLASVIFLLTMIGSASAIHIIGGEMYYTCVGPNTYEVTMKLYRDCGPAGGAQFDTPAWFGLFNESNQLVQTFSSQLESSEVLDPELPPCISIPPTLCVQEGIYQFTLTVPSNSETFTLVYQRCCRNQTIQNLADPGSQGLSIVVEFPALAEDECNSSPSYNNFPPPVLCAQEFLEFDHSATDTDGDSLAYSLCSPFIGANQNDPAPNPPSNPPYPGVTWGTGFSATNPINASPQFAIDPITGILTGTPTQLGQFVVGVCVEEWRDGVLLSVNTRDFQFNVAVCENSFEALVVEPSFEDLCDGLTFTFENESNPDNDFIWDFGDPSTEFDVSTSYSPTYTYADTGTYIITMITNPGLPCSDTAFIELPLYLETSIEVLIAGFECDDEQQIFNFEADGVFDQDASIVEWDFGPNATPQLASGLSVDGITFTTTGPQEVNVEVLNNFCEAQDVVTIQIPEPPSAVIDPQDVFCEGLNYQFSQTSQNANIYLWDFGVPGTDEDVSTQPQAGHTFPEAGQYVVSLTVSTFENCPVTVTESFDIQPVLAPEFDNPPIACLEGNQVNFEAGGQYTSDASFNWAFSNGTPATSTSENPSGITFDEEGLHPVSLTITEHGCTRTTDGTANIHLNPIADFNEFPAVGCAPLEVNFGNQSVTNSSSVAYEWDFGDGIRSSAKNTLHLYPNPGFYNVSLKITNLNGCIDFDQITKEGIIEVVPSPSANFRVSPGIVSVLNPEVEITNLSQGGMSCSYYIGGEYYETCDFTHHFENPVAQDIILTVTNEFGCSDQAIAQVKFSDHIIYIPNSFSPNLDGVNDIFIPVTTGVVEMEMHIIDRWGHEVYSSSDVGRGWDGGYANQASHFGQAEVYQYLIIVTDNLGWQFEYEGSVRLIR